VISPRWHRAKVASTVSRDPDVSPTCSWRLPPPRDLFAQRRFLRPAFPVGAAPREVFAQRRFPRPARRCRQELGVLSGSSAPRPGRSWRLGSRGTSQEGEFLFDGASTVALRSHAVTGRPVPWRAPYTGPRRRDDPARLVSPDATVDRHKWRGAGLAWHSRRPRRCPRPSTPAGDDDLEACCMTTMPEPGAFAKRWISAWNARDIEAVLADYSEDAVFTSPTAEARSAARTLSAATGKSLFKRIQTFTSSSWLSTPASRPSSCATETRLAGWSARC